MVYRTSLFDTNWGMKKILSLAGLLLTLGCGSLAAQTVSSYPLSGQPSILSIEQALASVGISNVVYKSSLNVGAAVGTLYEKASSDPNALEILFVKTSGGNVHLKTTWEYFTPVSQANSLYIHQIADPAAGASLVDENGANVNFDLTQVVQIQSDHSAIKFFATNGHTYILNMFYEYDGTNYYMVFAAPNNLATHGGTTRVEPGPPSQPPAN